MLVKLVLAPLSSPACANWLSVERRSIARASSDLCVIQVRGEVIDSFLIGLTALV
jgi:hypothetical protein